VRSVLRLRLRLAASDRDRGLIGFRPISLEVSASSLPEGQDRRYWYTDFVLDHSSCSIYGMSMS
jgi:hypothetical protein